MTGLIISGGLFGDPAYNKIVMVELAKVGILSAHWGWCQGTGNVERDINNAKQAIAVYADHCDTYIADIEPEVNDSRWKTDELDKFVDNLKTEDVYLAITTFGFVPWHMPELWGKVRDRVDGWDIQAYWHHLPSDSLVNNNYARRKNDPAYYCSVCLDEWENVVGVNPDLHLSGQAYWGEGGFTKQEAETQWQRFHNDFDQWERICGFGYWHLGSLAQSRSMMTAPSR